MNVVIGNRASSILYSWLLCNHIKGNVLLPANICESVPAVYLKAGCSLVFSDISGADYMMDLSNSNLKAKISEQNIAVLHYNHTYGYQTKQQEEALQDLRVAFPDLVIVEDCCLCAPAFEAPKDSTSDLILYSTGHTKVANIGYGGYAFMKDAWDYRTADDAFVEQDCEQFDVHVKACHVNPGQVNMDVFTSNWIDFSCKYGEEEFFTKVKEQYEAVMAHKNRINEIYRAIPGSLPDGYHVWRYQLLVENQEECIKALFDNGLFCSSHYMSLGNGYFDTVKTPNCDYLYTHVINLFNDFCYTEEQAEKTAEILCRIARKAER